jgi:hypothetical protein
MTLTGIQCGTAIGTAESATRRNTPMHFGVFCTCCRASYLDKPAPPRRRRLGTEVLVLITGARGLGNERPTPYNHWVSSEPIPTQAHLRRPYHLDCAGAKHVVLGKEGPYWGWLTRPPPPPAPPPPSAPCPTARGVLRARAQARKGRSAQWRCLLHASSLDPPSSNLEAAFSKAAFANPCASRSPHSGDGQLHEGKCRGARATFIF